MKIETQLRDGLVLNWALPEAALPPLPRALRYPRLSEEGQDRVFVSVVLFHHERLHWPSLPRIRFAWPQMNVRICVLDEEGVASFLIRRVFLPAWAYPGARLFAGPPVAAARLDFPRPSERPAEGEWIWRAARGRRFEVGARAASPAVGAGPKLGSWERTVRFFQDRPRAYTPYPDGLRRIDVRHPSAPVWPVHAELRETALLEGSLGLAAAGLPPLHSAWLEPEIGFSFELALAPRLVVPQGVPHPAASRAALFSSRTGRYPDTPPRPAA